MEDSAPKPSFKSLRTVRTRGDYALVLDLAAFVYAPTDKTVAARPAGYALLDWISSRRTIRSGSRFS